MENIIFREVQKFKQRWVWVLLLSSLVPTIFLTIYALYDEISLKSINPEYSYFNLETIAIVLLGIGIPIALLFLFKATNLLIEIRSTGLYYRYFPFINSFRFISIDEIESFEDKEYKALAEFGGWGIRYSMATKTKCYNVSGNLGVLITQKNGKKILFGSQKPSEFAAALNKIKSI